jgi:outer membrane protein assembly factor BamB
MIRRAADVPGTWPLLRRDERLSGHQSLDGAIRSPAIAWREYLGGPHYDGHLIARGRGADLLLPFGGCLHRYDHGGRLLWTSAAHGFESIVGIDDIDADGAIEIVASNGKSIVVLAAATGDVLWQQYLGPPFAGGFMHTAARLHRFDGFGNGMQLAVGLLSSKEVVVYDFSPGAATPERVHILWMDDFFHPSVLAADLDGDGRDELVVTKLSAVYAFDALSGAMTAECRWSSGGTPKRNYGMLEAIDILGTGRLDLVVLSDRVSRHLAVIANEGGGALSNRWDRFIEHIYDSDERELRFVSGSVVDIDRDGRPEIVVSIFNADGDGRWWLEVIDAATGETRRRLPDAYLRGVDRELPNAAPLLLVSFEHGRVPAPRSALAIFESVDGALVERWRCDDAAFVGRFAEPATTRAFFRADLPPTDDVRVAWIDGEPLVAVITDDGLGLLAIRDATPALRMLPGTTDVHSIIAVGDLDGDLRDELVVGDMHGGITVMQSDGTAIGAIRGGMRLRPGTGPYYMAKPMPTPVVDADARGRYCAVPDGGAEVHVFAWDATERSPRIDARMPMRGRVGPEEAYHALSWVRHGDRCALLGTTVGDGDAAMIAVLPDGQRVVSIPLSDLPIAPATPSARTGVYEYLLVDDDERAIIVAAGFRSPSMNSEILRGIDAHTGAVRWELDRLRMPGHVIAGAPWNAMSIERADGGGRIHFLAKDTLVAIEMLTGEHVAPPQQLRPFNTAALAARGLTMDDFSAYGAVCPIDVDADGSVERLLIANYGGHGVVRSDGSALWWHAAPLSSLTAGFGALADIDGDGRLELGVSDATGDFICLDAASGLEKWRLHLGQVATGGASCDIDGDGRNEFIVATREGHVMAIAAASNGSGLIRWSIDLGYSLGPPVIADFNGDGRSEILVVSGDGHLYAIDDRAY